MGRPGGWPSTRHVLLLLALLILVGSLWLDRQGAGHLWAQASPLTQTPLITPTKSNRVVNEITHPQPGDAVAGVVEIWGTALVPSYHRYDVHISPANLDNWQWLTTSYQVVREDVLYRLDTTQFPDGFYDLRVRAIRDDGNYTEAFLRGLEIRNANPPTPTPVPGAPPQPPSVIPTPTPTVDVSSRVPGGQGFYAPDNGAVLRGAVPIVATVNGLPNRPFARYELAFSRAGWEQWQWLAGSEEQFWQAPIAVWDTTQVPDGLYDLRLRIIYRDGNYNEYFLRNLSVANQGPPTLAFAPPVGIVSPRSGWTVGPLVDVVGTVPAEGMLRWELSWSLAGKEEWRLLTVSDRLVQDGLLARLDLSQLQGHRIDLRLRIVHPDQNYHDHVVRDLTIRVAE
ncbi:MAG: hypothetical protein KatS3mg050_1650 [Litorilinea sp.]|nr:MAG: hypothetical protein KatS3mg050_1650 [Litorilinea sp.]